MPSHPSEEDLQKWMSGTAQMCQEVPTDDPRYAEYHSNINKVLDHMESEGQIGSGG